MDADDLYALAPEDFTAARDAAAKQARAAGDRAGATALLGLRRPSVAAWLVNRLVAGQGQLLEELLALGPALAAAQSAGRADELRALGQQRRALVEAVAGAAVHGAARPVSATARDELVATLEAALADQASADAVRSGRLVRALSYAGFGGVDLAGAVGQAPVAAGSAGGQPPRPTVTAKRAERDRRARVAAAEAAAHDAAGRLDDAVRECEGAQRRRTATADAAAGAERAVERARLALAAAEQQHDAARTARQQALAAADAAVQAVGAAQRDAESARAALDRLRRS